MATIKPEFPPYMGEDNFRDFPDFLSRFVHVMPPSKMEKADPCFRDRPYGYGYFF
jgi:hypothetical protein